MGNLGNPRTPGRLTTHVLDTMHGVPAAGMQVRLYWLGDDVVPSALAPLTSTFESMSLIAAALFPA